MKQSATCQGNVQREALKSHNLLQSHMPVVSILVRFMFCCVHQADRRDVVCHLVGRGCGVTRLCVLGANARFSTEYDSKGYGLMRLAGHTLKHWPFTSLRLSNVPLCSTASLETGFLTHNCGTRNSCIHNSFTRNFLTHNLFTLIHKYSKLPQTQLFAHTTVSPPCITPTHTQLLHVQFFLNLSILHHLLYLSFLPRPASILVSHYWKKLTCGVIWSFN